jgi:signal transduction histidine kinase
MDAANRRKKKLIEPRIQIRFALTHITTSALAALVQAIIVSYLLMRIADGLPNDGMELKSQLPDILAGSLLVTVLLLVPLTLIVGISSSHKIVGPLYRFRQYLTKLRAGEKTEPCKIREDDELQDFCELLNAVTEPLRRAEEAPPRREAA